MTAVLSAKAAAARVRKLTGVSGAKFAPVRSRPVSKGCWSACVIGRSFRSLGNVSTRGREDRKGRGQDRKGQSDCETGRGVNGWFCLKRYETEPALKRTFPLGG